MNETLIELRNLTKFYGRTRALSAVNLQLQSGQIVGLCGPNGSGKTTIIKILNGLLHNYTGQVIIDGHKPDQHTRSLISYLPDVTYLPEWMTGKELITMFRDLYTDFDSGKMDELLARMQLDKTTRIRELSKGNKEKFQLALVMSRRARIYILDEPIAGVDPAAREFILDTILNNYAEDALLLLSTHLIADVEKIFDSVIFLKQGEVSLFRRVDDIREQEKCSVDQLFREVFRC